MIALPVAKTVCIPAHTDIRMFYSVMSVSVSVLGLCIGRF